MSWKDEILAKNAMQMEARERALETLKAASVSPAALAAVEEALDGLGIQKMYPCTGCVAGVFTLDANGEIDTLRLQSYHTVCYDVEFPDRPDGLKGRGILVRSKTSGCFFLFRTDRHDLLQVNQSWAKLRAR